MSVSRIARAGSWTKFQAKRIFYNPKFNLAKVALKTGVASLAVGSVISRAPWPIFLAIFSVREIGLSKFLSGIKGLLIRLWPFTSKSEGSRPDIDQDIDRIV